MMISIIIPVYEMGGRGVEMLDDLLRSIEKQSYQDCEVIISDNSENNQIRDYVGHRYKYVRNEKRYSPSANLNNALKYATGEIIKPMMQDDYFTDENTLKVFAEMTKGWAVCVSRHTDDRGDHRPYEQCNIIELVKGCNTFGSPSAVAWRRNELRFDENLLWLVDCDFYAQLIRKCGQPDLLNTSVTIRIWDGQMTNIGATGSVRIDEANYVINKWQ